MPAANNKYMLLGVALLLIGIIIAGRYLLAERAKSRVSVIAPELSPEALVGEKLFATNCAACHGANAAGTDKGPPLIDPIYHPGHHADFSFVRAVTLGVPQHHWYFGPMPPQPQVQRAEIDRIVAYIRAVQRANGIR